MSLGHKLKMRWCISGFVVILCKYGLLLKKPFVVSVSEVIWAVSFDSLLKPNLYVDVDNVVRLWFQFDEEEMWTMNSPLEVRILRAMWT